MRRVTMLVATATAVLALAFVAAAPARAGGWASVTLDPLVGPPKAGETVPVGYTILGHGESPISLSDTYIAVTAADGTVVRHPGRPDGKPGHHVADVRFPTAGSYRWSIGPFPQQPLGTIDVIAAASAAAPAPVEPVETTTVVVREPAWPAAARVGVTVAAGVAFLALGAQLFLSRRRTPPHVPA